MKFLLAFVFALLMPMAALAADAQTDATAAAKAWLALVDKGDFQQSWNDASKLLQSRISADQWAQSAKPIHETLGGVVSRDVSGVEMMSTLPGAPDGQYAIVRFKTKFEKKDTANETVTMMMDNGTWRSAGYFIN